MSWKNVTVLLINAVTELLFYHGLVVVELTLVTNFESDPFILQLYTCILRGTRNLSFLIFILWVGTP